MGDRIGFFPANFVQRVRPGETVWRCCRTFYGNKEQGQLSLKENQVRVYVPKYRHGQVRPLASFSQRLFVNSQFKFGKICPASQLAPT